jgi:hypothetical protein
VHVEPYGERPVQSLGGGWKDGTVMSLGKTGCEDMNCIGFASG